MLGSIATYQPAFGVASTAQQFPFGQSNQPGTTLCLVWYAYSYDSNGLLQVATKLNKEAPYVEASPT